MQQRIEVEEQNAKEAKRLVVHLRPLNVEPDNQRHHLQTRNADESGRECARLRDYDDEREHNCRNPGQNCGSFHQRPRAFRAHPSETKVSRLAARAPVTLVPLMARRSSPHKIHGIAEIRIVADRKAPARSAGEAIENGRLAACRRDACLHVNPPAVSRQRPTVIRFRTMGPAQSRTRKARPAMRPVASCVAFAAFDGSAPACTVHLLRRARGAIARSSQVLVGSALTERARGCSACTKRASRA
mmetsp:Transcript_16993/g.55586  ORF Transcript_16993/g.55586 Transcript_16993/m.55586 type:complete len:244 (-) Transcript_16993:1250-1981(-)